MKKFKNKIMNSDYKSVLKGFFARYGNVLLAYVGIIVLLTFFINYQYKTLCKNSPLLEGCNGVVILFGLALILPIVGYVLFYICGYKFSKVFLMCAIAWGIIFQIIVPPLCGTDEWIHYKSAYWVSDNIMGTVSEEDTVLMRQQDTIYYELSYSHSALTLLFDDIDETYDESNREQIVNTDSWNLHQWYRFIPSAIGITIARLLHLRSTATIYLGRIFNLIVFILVGWYCTKILPIGKAQMVNLTMVPLLMQQVSGYSYDCLSISFSVLLFSLCIYYSYCERSIKIWDVLLFALALGGVAVNKGVYVFFSLMLLAIPFVRVKETAKRIVKTKKLLFVLALIIPAFGLIGYFAYKRLAVYVNILLFKNESASIEQATEYTAWTMTYAIKHPLDTIKLFFHSILNLGDTLIQMMGKKLGGHALFIPISTSLLISLLIIIFIQLLYKRGNWIGWKKYIVWMVTFFAVLLAILLGCMVRFTAVGAYRIDASARYFLPLFACTLIVNGTKQEEAKEILHFYTAQHIVMVFVAMEMFVSMYGLETATLLGLM